MRLKLVRAATIGQAMAEIRATLGRDALILGTRQLGDGVEVTAALEPDEPAVPSVVVASDPVRLDALRRHGIPAAMHAALDHGPLADALATVLSFGALPLLPYAAPLLFVGPPGAGKTLTVVRLATRLTLAGTPPMVVTADDRRAGAGEQLAALTRVLGIDLVVTSHPATLARALMRRAGDAVLIDTAGSNPFDPADTEPLRMLAAAAGARVVLVLPAGLDPGEAEDLASGYAAFGADLLIATRLDLARRLGAPIAAAAAGRMMLTEAGIGPGAADGLVALTPAFLADRLSQTGARVHVV